jgi:nucleotide-binding universal stress UspA family protein
MFRRILVPTDFSEPSDAALAYARVLAGRFGASLHVLHVFESPFVAGSVSPEVFVDDSPAVQAALFEEAKNRLQHRVTAADREQFGATTEIVSGRSARTIVDYAIGRNMDLIVMGTHGRSGVAHLLMGSVAEKVVRTAACPVMTVRRAPVPEFAVPQQPTTEWVPAAG